MEIQCLFPLCCQQVDICGFELNVSTSVGWTAQKFADIHAPLRMIYYSFGAPFLVYDQIYTKLITFPSALARL